MEMEMVQPRSTSLIDESDDERDSFDVQRRYLQEFRDQLLNRSWSSSEDDDEGIIDGTKIPSSSKAKSRLKHSFLDLSLLSTSSSSSIPPDHEPIDDDDPVRLLSTSIITEEKPKKSKKSLGIPRTKVTEETIRKPSKADVLETERKMQQLTRSEQLVLPKFVPKPFQSFQELEKRSRKELLHEIRAKNPSFTPQSPDLPDIPAPSTTESTLAELTQLIEVKKIDRLSRFLNPEILKKKPSLAKTDLTIDLSETKKPPTVKTSVILPSESPATNSSRKNLFEMQKQLGLRMKEKRAAMLAENPINIPEEKDEPVEEEAEDESESESEGSPSEVLSTVEREPVLPLDEETRDFISDDEDEGDVELIGESVEMSNPPSNPDRPSLKTVLSRMESQSEATSGQTEWFAASEPVPVDEHLELLCSGTFGGDNAIPLSQNEKQVAPMAFSPLPPTQIDPMNDDEEEDLEVRTTTKPKVRLLSDEDEEEEEEEEENEELVDFKKQLFEMEAEESGSENEEKILDEDEDEDEESDDEADEELAKFIDTDAMDVDEDEVAKVHLKLKAKEDEQQLKLLKEQYLYFDGDDDGRRLQIGKGMNQNDDDDEEENEEEEPSEEEDEEEEEEETLPDRMSELERQRLIQDNQAEEAHLDEDLENIAQHSSMFKKGLELKQKKNPTHLNENPPKKTVPSRSVTMSSVFFAQRFSSTLLAPVTKSNAQGPSSSSSSHENNANLKKQHNPRRHVFAANPTRCNAQENENPQITTNPSGEKRANSTEKSPSMKTKRFKQSINPNKSTEPSSSVFSALALSTDRH